MSEGINPKNEAGAAKPSFHNIPPSALVAIGRVMEVGEQKYGRLNWRNQPVQASVYYDAAMRHLLSFWDGSNLDPETGLPHLWLAASNLAILIDGYSLDGGIDDNRPTFRGAVGEMIADLNSHIGESFR